MLENNAHFAMDWMEKDLRQWKARQVVERERREQREGRRAQGKMMRRITERMQYLESARVRLFESGGDFEN